MNLVELERKLLRAARACPPRDQVPLGFEKRIMARLMERQADLWAFWNRTLWRAAASFCSLALILGVWTAVVVSSEPSGETLASDLEQTVLAPIYLASETW